MTEWTTTTNNATSWNAGTGQNTNTSVAYDDINIKYNLDYITYEGYYVEDETDWSTSSSIQTAWASA